MKQKKMLIALLTFVAFLLSAGIQASENKQAAKEHFNIGNVHYKLGRFEEALKEYSKAYELMSHPGFLFNIGQCQRKLGNYEQAIFYYNGYMREMPKAQNRSLVERLITESERELKKLEEERRRQEEIARKKEEKHLRKLEIEKLEKQRQLAEAEKAREKEKKLALQAKKMTPLPLDLYVPTKPEDPAFYKKWWFWTIVGGTIAAVAGGTLYAVTSGDKSVLPSGSLGRSDFRF